MPPHHLAVALGSQRRDELGLVEGTRAREKLRCNPGLKGKPAGKVDSVKGVLCHAPPRSHQSSALVQSVAQVVTLDEPTSSIAMTLLSHIRVQTCSEAIHIRRTNLWRPAGDTHSCTNVYRPLVKMP